MLIAIEFEAPICECESFHDYHWTLDTAGEALSVTCNACKTTVSQSIYNLKGTIRFKTPYPNGFEKPKHVAHDGNVFRLFPDKAEDV